MTWWTFCCGDESSIQSSSNNNSPTTTGPSSSAGALLGVGATESSPLLAQDSAAAKKKDRNDESTSPQPRGPDASEAKVEQSTCGDSRIEAPSDGPDADAVAWKKARANLLQSCPSDPVSAFTNQTNEWTNGDLMLSEPLDSLPKPTTMKHIAQLSTWDCGIACLEMVFDWLGIAAVTDRQVILERIPTMSVWSADLVQLLDQRLFPNLEVPLLDYGRDKDGLTDAFPSLPSDVHPTGRYLFCSQTLSVNDELNSFAYYQSTFDSDRSRVGAAFQWLQERRGESLLQRASLPLRDILELLLRPDCVAIVLVDNAILTGLRRADAVTTEMCTNLWHQEESEGVDVSSGTGPGDDPAPPPITESTSTVVYMGHYILLTGVVTAPKPVVFEGDSDDNIDDDESADEPFQLQAHNPSLDFGPVLLSPRLLDDARRAPGTDHDILFIVKTT